MINSLANSLPLLYLGAALGGIGVGCVYGTCVGNALKWFPDRRGLAAGITAAGFGVGSAFTIIPIQNIIRSSGYEAAFLWFGLGQGLIILALAPLLRTAPATTCRWRRRAASRRDIVTARPRRCAHRCSGCCIS